MSPPSTARQSGTLRQTSLTVGALGVVFGDIGTSPLYAMEAVFSGGRVAPVPDSVYGILSLVIWTLMVVVTIKYVALVMRAAERGEGGIMALVGLVAALDISPPRVRLGLVLAGVAGAALFLGDGMITPAISVLSAVEGAELAVPSLKPLVVPITLVILTALFAAQRFGTSAVGRLFGPIMAVWFAAIAAAGLAEILAHPGVLRSLSPHYGARFILEHPGTAFVALGAIVLTVTGAEALYADMGHFGRRPISRAWLAVVLPAVSLNYLGQGALIARTAGAARDPFYLLVPSWGQLPMVLLATAATVIAAQAVISGAYSLARQAMRQGYLPRLSVLHTSEREPGQVYVPAVNAMLFLGVTVVVVAFGSSARLASAYGLAVTGTFAVTTILFLVVAHRAMGWKLRRTVAVGFALLVVDLSFFASSLSKIPSGGWLPVALAIAGFTLLTTWHRGAAIASANLRRQEGPLQAFVDGLNAGEPVPRIGGTAVFLGADKATTPLALRAHVQHMRVLHEQVVILTVVTEPRAHLPGGLHIDIDDLGHLHDGVVHVSARFGFKDRHDVPAALELAARRGLRLDVERASYFVSRMSLKRTDAPGLAGWRKRLFLAMTKMAANPVEYFALPDDRVVVLGSRVMV